MALLSKTYSEHYTVFEWEHWKDNWELIDGVPYCMSPAPTVKHQSVNGKIYAQFLSKLNECKKCNVYLPIDWVINEDTVVQPDVLVVCKEITTKRLEFAPSIIFEISSPSTARKDKTEKFELYQSQCVKYYVMVNPDTQEIELFQLINGVYIKQNFENNFIFEIEECSVDIDFKNIW